MIPIKRTVDLSEPIRTETLRGNEFTGEAMAHRFVIHVTQDGEAITLTGTISAYFLQANGASQDITGSTLCGLTDDGAAWVSLPSECYSVPGRFHLTIYHSSGSDTTCIYSCVGSVVNSIGDPQYDPGNAIGNLTQLIGEAEQAATDAASALAQATAVVSYAAQTPTTANQIQARYNISAISEYDALEATYKTPVSMLTTDGEAIRVISGGVATAGGDNNSTSRARTQYFRVQPNTQYAFILSAADFVIINAFEYSGTTAGSCIGLLFPSGSVLRTAMVFTTSATANFVRVSFAHTDKTTTVSESDRDAILAGISLRVLTDTALETSGAPADAYAVGYTVTPLSNLMPMQTVSWDELGANATGNGIVLAWRAGYWDETNTRISNNTHSVTFWSYFQRSGSYVFNRANDVKYVWITAPNGTTGRIRGFTSGDGGSTYTVQVENISFTGTYRLKLSDNTRYRFYLIGIEDNAAWLTEANVRTIIMRWSPYDDTHKPTPGANVINQYFTVNVERPASFADETADTSTVSVQCALRMPGTYRPFGTPTRMVFMAHGAHGYIDKETDTWYSTAWGNLCTELVNAGYGVFDCNVLPGRNADWVSQTGVNENWAGYALGSPLYLQVVKAAYDYIQTNYNVYQQIFVHGTSMGGTGATAFAHAYPQLVLAESSFAGRDTIMYIKSLHDWISDGSTAGSGIDDGRFAAAWGYSSISALISDKWSHIEGVSPSLTLTKVKSDGTVETAPDRETAFSDWLAWFDDIYGDYANVAEAKAYAVGNWIGWRRVPYKAWNSWADNYRCTKLEQFLRKAYSNGGCCYNLVEYDNYTHDDMCFGQNSAVAAGKLPEQMIAWFKRWE